MNIIYIITDQQRYDTINTLGYPFMETPNIDKLVKEKVLECEKFADESPYPDKSLMYDAVYEQENYPFLKHKLD